MRPPVRSTQFRDLGTEGLMCSRLKEEGGRRRVLDSLLKKKKVQKD